MYRFCMLSIIEAAAEYFLYEEPQEYWIWKAALDHLGVR